MLVQAGFKKQLQDVLHDVEQEEQASKDLKRRYDEAVGRCVGLGMLTGWGDDVVEQHKLLLQVYVHGGTINHRPVSSSASKVWLSETAPFANCINPSKHIFPGPGRREEVAQQLAKLSIEHRTASLQLEQAQGRSCCLSRGLQEAQAAAKCAPSSFGHNVCGSAVFNHTRVTRCRRAWPSRLPLLQVVALWVCVYSRYDKVDEAS